MSRSGYSDDCDPLDFGRWRAQVRSAIRGKRGQAFFRELLGALDAMPDKRLISSDLQDANGCMCALGVLAEKKGALAGLDTYDWGQLGRTFDIAHQLAQEVMYENDEGAWRQETPEERWHRMRAWVVSQMIANTEATP